MADIYIPNAANWINALEAGREGAMTRRKQQATADAGRLMTSGDYAGAAAALMPHDLGAGLQLQKYGEEQKTKARRADIRKKFGEDPDAALGEALEFDDELYKDLREIKDEAQKKQYQQFGAILRTIGRQEPDQWDDLIAANRAQLIAVGAPESEINAFLAAAPEQRQTMMAAMLARADQFDKFMEQGDKDRTHAATQADREADNRRADAQLGISRQQLGVSQGNLAQRRAEHAARLAGEGGYAVPGVAYGDLPAGATVILPGSR